MPDTARQKQLLFVDDDAAFLSLISQLFIEMSGGKWEVLTAENHAQALEMLNSQRMDVVVLDVGMPVMDGIQFLRLLSRTHPSQQVVMLTGLATDENRKACLEGGATLVLEKPTDTKGLAGVFSALDALVGAQPQEGFRGLMRRVGLHEVIQLECLGRKSSVLEIFTSKARGRIFIREGDIIHAESGALQGEVALYGLLAMRGGQFNLMTFTPPPQQTIEGNWEMLLMEAARLNDENTQQQPEPAAFAPLPGEIADTTISAAPSAPIKQQPQSPDEEEGVHIEEIVLCSGSGEVLYDWKSDAPEQRQRLIEQIEQMADDLNSVAPVGRFDRLEVLTPEGRIVCQAEAHRRLWVRSAPAKI